MNDNPARVRMVADYIESMLSVNFKFESDLAYIMATLHGDSGMGDRIQGGEMLAEQEKYPAATGSDLSGKLIVSRGHLWLLHCPAP